MTNSDGNHDENFAWMKETFKRWHGKVLAFILVASLILAFLVMGVLISVWIMQAQFVTTYPHEPQLTPQGVFFSNIINPLLAPLCTALGTLLIFLCAVIFAILQTRSQNKTLKMQEKGLEHQKELQKNQMDAEQFKHAIDHLGHNNNIAKLGGVYALNDLARNDKDDRYSRIVFEALNSFVREETRKTKYYENIQAIIKKEKPLHDDVTSLNIIQTVINRLFRRGESSNLYGNFYATTNLKGADLREVHFKDAILNCSQTVVWEVDSKILADLRNVDLRRVNLENANLKRVILRNAQLQGAKLQGANLQRANLNSAELQCVGAEETNLRKAEMQGAYLKNANLQGVNLYGTKLQGAFLWGTDLRSARLCGVDMRGAYLCGANFSATTELNGDTDMRGVQSLRGITRNVKNFYYEGCYLKTINSGQALVADYSGIEISTDDGTQVTDKEAWFRERGAKVGNLSWEEVKNLAEELGYIPS